MKNQVLSIEQMRHLQKLGVDTSKASCCWCSAYDIEQFVMPIEDKDFFNSDKLTFTLQDMLEMIPKSIEDWFMDSGMRKQIASFEMYIRDNSWHICYTIYDDEVYSNDDDDLLNCTYETLCWLAENGYLKGGEK